MTEKNKSTSNQKKPSVSSSEKKKRRPASSSQSTSKSRNLSGSRTSSIQDTRSRKKRTVQSNSSKDVSFFVKLNRILIRVFFFLILVLGFSIYKFVTAFHGIQDPATSIVIEADSDEVNEDSWYDSDNSQENRSDPDSSEDSDSFDENDWDEESNNMENSEEESSEEESSEEESSEEESSGSVSLPDEIAAIPDPMPSVITDELRYELEAAFYEDVPSSDLFYYSDSPSYCQPMSIDSMYFTGIAFDLYRYSYELCDSRLFVTTTGENTIREIYDIETGQQLGSYPIDEMNTLLTGCLEGGRSYVIGTDLSLQIYRESGDLDQYMTYSALDGLSRQSISLITVTQDGDYLCVRQVGSSAFTFIRINDGSSFTMTIENAPVSLGLLEHTDNLILTDYRSTILTIDPDNQDWSLRWIESPFVLYSDGLLYDVSSKSVSVYDQDNDLCTFRSIWNHETILGARGGLIITALDRNGDYLNDALHFYDFNRNEYRELILPAGYGVYNVLFPGSGRILLCYNHGDSDGFAFVELNDLSYIGSLDPVFSSMDCLESETRYLADLAYEQYGVSIFYGEEGNNFNLDDYRGSVCSDGLRNYEAVLNVYNLLRLFPSNMLRECYEGFCESLDLYLCADISGVGDSGLSFAGGVSNQVGNHLILALDIYEPYTFNLPHELAHLFDYRIRQHFWMQNEELDDYWITLSPDGAFTYSYSGYENLDYYILGYADSDDVYFTRNYARTMPNEDRATIFESMFDHPGQEANSVFEYTHLKEKAKAYAKLLRDAFPSCANSGRLYWEIGLE